MTLYSKPHPKKQEIIDILARELGDNPQYEWLYSNDRTSLSTIFSTGLSSPCLRLSTNGAIMFEDAGIEHYSIPHDQDKRNWYTNKYILLLSKFTSPYYMGPKTIREREGVYTNSHLRIYDGKVAMLITLYGGITNYLESTYK